MRTYYNEFDPHAAAWLRELIREGLISPGEVDERSIQEVATDDLRGFDRCHFFAGISGWELALQLARWPLDRPVWTGSCPCQPYSSAGKGEGDKDPRNLWPDFFRLIRECRPERVFGEQVASSDVVGTELEASFVTAVQRGDARRANQLAERIAKKNAGSDLATLAPRWVDRVRADVEGEGYTFGFKVLGAHSAGADHIRQRLFWVADRDRERLAGRAESHGRAEQPREPASRRDHSGGGRPDGELAHAECQRDGNDRPGAIGGEASGMQGADGERERLRANTRKRRRVVFAFDERSFESIDKLREQGRIWPSPELFDRVAATLAHARESLARQLADAPGDGRPEHERLPGPGEEPDPPDASPGPGAGVAQGDAGLSGLPDAESQELRGEGRGNEGRTVAQSGGAWADSSFILCRDGKARRVPTQPGLFPLAHGVSGRVVVVRPGVESETAVQAEDIRHINRVGALKGAGNAIVPEIAAAFIEAYLEAQEGR